MAILPISFTNPLQLSNTSVGPTAKAPTAPTGNYNVTNAAGNGSVLPGTAIPSGYTTAQISGAPKGAVQVVPTSNTSSNTSNTGTSTVTPAVNTGLDQASIAATQQSLDQLPSILNSSLTANRNTYNTAQSALDAQKLKTQADYNTNTTTNQQNYDANLMDSLRTGATGLSGLLSILRGTGEEGWARDAVQNTTNGDIKTGLNTQKNNQTSLDQGLSNYLGTYGQDSNKNKDALASGTASANLSNANNLQSLYTKMASYYANEGDNANASKYMGMAGAEAPSISQYSVAPVTSYATTLPTVAAPTISAFNAPTAQGITSTNGSPVAVPNSGIFSVGDTSRKLSGVGV